MKTGMQVGIIAAALIWVSIIIAPSMVLEGAPQSSRVLTLLGGGAAATIILLGGLAIREKRM